MNVRFNAGRLTSQITLQAKSGGPDEYGQVVPVYSDVATIYAEFMQKTSKEFYVAQKVYETTTAVFKTHYQNGVTPLLRVKFGSRNFEILGVDNVEQRNVCLLIMAKEIY